MSRPRIQDKPDDPRHGTVNGYVNLKCRCTACRVAWADEFHEYRLRNHRGITPEHVHGTENGYHNYGCRCDACTAVSSRESRLRKWRQRERERGQAS